MAVGLIVDTVAWEGALESEPSITQRGEGQKNIATLRNERNILVVDNQEIIFYLRPEVQTVAVE